MYIYKSFLKNVFGINIIHLCYYRVNFITPANTGYA